MFRKIILSILMLSSLFSSILLAVGLGDYKLNSRLNQPLSAEIDLLFTDDYAIHELNAVLASQSEFDKVGVDRIFFLNDLRFKTVKGKNGKLVLKLTTRREVKEPFLNFLVELNWPNGRMIREYTFLLDPPLYDSSTSSTIQKTQTTYSPVYQTEKKNRPNPAPKKAQDFSFTGSTYGPVKENDTLWSIATKARPNSRVSIQQTLVAIFRANPDAFAEGNINNLLKGKVLQIPDAETVASVPHRAALQDVVMQNKQWRSGGARKIVGNSNNTSSSSNASKGGRLTLATPDSSGGGGASGSGTSDEELAVIEARLA
ncbi:MAG: peptigoglycan-binding protein LysM, partial [Gammaproteobacteria bacterium]|nr:peptigoglycan-binding protein LysM [Gammaproteobacteria bacterium]